MEPNLPLEKQIEVLADFIQATYPEKILNGGAIETAIQILTEAKQWEEDAWKYRDLSN